jgi:hypothetical protein
VCEDIERSTAQHKVEEGENVDNTTRKTQIGYLHFVHNFCGDGVSSIVEVVLVLNYCHHYYVDFSIGDHTTERI